MEIVFASGHRGHGEEWLQAFRQALPGWRVRGWDEDAPGGTADVAVVWNPPAAMFERERQLKIVFNLGAGVDALMGLPQLPSDVPVVRIEDGGMAVQMAEYVLHYLVRASRGLGDYARQQAECRWHRLRDFRRQDWTVGVMGAGAIGGRIAAAIAAFDYPVAVWSRSGRAPAGLQGHAGEAGLPAFLARSRVLVNVLPLTPQTRGILNRELFAQMPRGGLLINIARGDHLVEGDLLEALATGQLAGAVLDVFAQEPLPVDHAFWRHPQIQLTPHIAGLSLLDETVAQVSAKAEAFRRGEPVSGIVDRTLQY